MPLKRILFIRPGETDWNLQGRFQGWVAAPLNDLGRQQIERLSSFVRHAGISKLYSSDTQRARESAAILGEALGYEPILDNRLREQHIGIWQGLTVPEIHGWYPDEYVALQTDPENYPIPGGESRAQVKVRAVAAINAIIDRALDDADAAVGIVTHTTAVQFMLAHLVPDADLTTARFANSSVTTAARIDSELWRLTVVNDLMHLEGLESRYMPGDVRGEDKL